MKRVKINILSHLYYSEIPELGNFNKIQEITCNFFFNICLDKISDFEDVNLLEENNRRNLTIITSSNIGKDIGGKLALVDLSFRLNARADYYLFIHDKQSPHTSLGRKWKEKLFRIIQTENIRKIIALFESDKKIGIICAKEFIMNEYDETTDGFICNSNRILRELIRKYSLAPSSYDFVGGTMFWIRAGLVDEFFLKYPPLEIRSTLETGNVLDNEEGTVTHAWERILSWIATDKGYYIKGI